MKETYKPRIPELFEAFFDIGYLVFDLYAIAWFVNYGTIAGKVFIMYAILTLILFGGDAFHLLPRVFRVFNGPSEKVKQQMGRGLQISSITMTVFYILLMYIWQLTFPELVLPVGIKYMIWISAIIRIAICLLPQNNWLSGGNMILSILRNGIFIITGLGVALLYAKTENYLGGRMVNMVYAIIISFGCYLPVTLWSKKKPMIGMLMIPKTCAYIWMILMGLDLMP